MEESGGLLLDDPNAPASKRANIVQALMGGYSINPEALFPQINFAQPAPPPMPQAETESPLMPDMQPPRRHAPPPTYSPFPALQNIVMAERLKGLFGVGTQSPAPVSDAVPSWWAPGA